jgi:hypothetical protein
VEVARQTGRSLNAIYTRRRLLGLRDGRHDWSAEEDALVRTLPPVEVMRRTGRSARAVAQRRYLLGVT